MSPRRIRCADTYRQKHEGPGALCQCRWGGTSESWHGGRVPCGEQGWHLPGGLHTQRGPWGASSLAARHVACRSCHRGAHLTVCGSERFPGAHNPRDSLRRQWLWLFGWELTISQHPHSTAWPPAAKGGPEVPHPALPEGLNQNLRAGSDLLPVGIHSPGHSLAGTSSSSPMLADPPWR